MPTSTETTAPASTKKPAAVPAPPSKMSDVVRPKDPRRFQPNLPSFLDTPSAGEVPVPHFTKLPATLPDSPKVQTPVPADSKSSTSANERGRRKKRNTKKVDQRVPEKSTATAVPPPTEGVKSSVPPPPGLPQRLPPTRTPTRPVVSPVVKPSTTSAPTPAEAYSKPKESTPGTAQRPPSKFEAVYTCHAGLS